jgi:hypothetical protein
VEAQTSALVSATLSDAIANHAPAGDRDDARAMWIRQMTIECALGAANAAGA